MQDGCQSDVYSALLSHPRVPTMSLYKIPLVLMLALEFRAMLTPPHAPPAKDEVVESIAIDFPGIRKYRLTFTRGGQLAFAAAEIIIIAALAFPSSPVAQKALAVLVLPGGNPHHLSLNSLSLLGAALWIAGSRIRIWTYRELGRFFRFDISIQRNHELITSGPYAYVRHPSYTGMLLANLGWFLWTFAPGSWIRECGIMSSYTGLMLLAVYIIIGLLPALVVTLGRMSREDDALKQEFGSQWEEWYQEVPYAVIPGVY